MNVSGVVQVPVTLIATLVLQFVLLLVFGAVSQIVKVVLMPVRQVVLILVQVVVLDLAPILTIKELTCAEMFKVVVLVALQAVPGAVHQGVLPLVLHLVLATILVDVFINKYMVVQELAPQVALPFVHSIVTQWQYKKKSSNFLEDFIKL